MSEFVDKLAKMTVPELWFELNTKPHTVVDQYIITELIKKKQTEQLICQAQRKKGCQFNRGCVGGKPENLPCNIIKNNDNNRCLDNCVRPTNNLDLNIKYDETFSYADFNTRAEESTVMNRESMNRDSMNRESMNRESMNRESMNRESMNRESKSDDKESKSSRLEDNANNQLNNRFMDDIKTVNSIHKKTTNKPFIQAPYL
jgi:hypothetical protein